MNYYSCADQLDNYSGSVYTRTTSISITQVGLLHWPSKLSETLHHQYGTRCHIILVTIWNQFNCFKPALKTDLYV